MQSEFEQVLCNDLCRNPYNVHRMTKWGTFAVDKTTTLRQVVVLASP